MSTISVVIPTYNRAELVPAAVCSALAQEGVGFEVIVIDDGSTDDTETALAPWLDRIRYIKTANGGVSAARNRGIREATGDWIAFLDSDDTWQPGKLRRQLECAAKTGAKVCFCVSTDESGEALDDIQKMNPGLAPGSNIHHPRDDCRLFLHSRHPFLQSMLVERAALLATGGFDPTLRVAEDTRLIYQLTLAHGHAVVNEPLVAIRRDRDEHGLSDSPDAASAERRFDCYVRVQSEAFWRVLPVDAAASRVVRGNLLYFTSRLAEIRCALDQRDSARRTAWAAIHPRAGLKSLLRNLFIILFYQSARRRFLRKWGTSSENP